jgi:hypothetical protein
MMKKLLVTAVVATLFAIPFSASAKVTPTGAVAQPNVSAAAKSDPAKGDMMLAKKHKKHKKAKKPA